MLYILALNKEHGVTTMVNGQWSLWLAMIHVFEHMLYDVVSLVERSSHGASPVPGYKIAINW